MALKINLLLLICVCVLNGNFGIAQTTVRPYKFGFTIDEQQHRFEKRDERGIVMGEFGFITADGIYHVTVYATDEEGRFRILAFKNYPYNSTPKTIEMVITPKNMLTKSVSTTVPTTERSKFDFGQKACSGCFLTNKNQGKKPKTDIRTLSKTIGTENPTNIPTISGTNLQVPKTIKDIAEKATNTILIKPENRKTIPTNTEGSNSSNKNSVEKTTTSTINNGINKQNSNTQQNTNTKISTTTTYSNKGKVKTPPTANIRPPQPPKTQPNTNTVKNGRPVLPNTVSNTGKVAATPSLSKPRKDSASPVGSDTGDLYRFKYILDYNGHSETGSRNGNKQGSFYSIGDDNIERTIEYIANEFGFQPRIRWRKINPNEIKSKENTLKDYEFVWFKQP